MIAALLRIGAGFALCASGVLIGLMLLLTLGVPKPPESTLKWSWEELVALWGLAGAAAAQLVCGATLLVVDPREIAAGVAGRPRLRRLLALILIAAGVVSGAVLILTTLWTWSSVAGGWGFLVALAQWSVPVVLLSAGIALARPAQPARKGHGR